MNILLFIMGKLLFLKYFCNVIACVDFQEYLATGRIELRISVTGRTVASLAFQSASISLMIDLILRTSFLFIEPSFLVSLSLSTVRIWSRTTHPILSRKSTNQVISISTVHYFVIAERHCLEEVVHTSTGARRCKLRKKVFQILTCDY